MFSIFVGTYDKAIFGWEAKCITEGDGEKHLKLELSLAYPTHLGCIKAIDASGKWLASGSTDESVKVYDIVNKKEIGTLMKHEDKISCLQFYQLGHLLTGSADGTVCIWRAKDWECIRVLKGHSDGINSLSIHPSGKLALTCARDRTIRMWNLINGRSAYDEKLSYEAEIVSWSPSGNCYAIGSHSSIRVFSIAGETLHKYEQPNYEHILTMVFVKEDVIASGGEDRKITLWNTKTGEILHTIEGFGNRIKGLCLAPKTDFPIIDYPKLLVSISSDHTIKVWDLDHSATQPCATVYVEGRLVCVSVSTVIDEIQIGTEDEEVVKAEKQVINIDGKKGNGETKKQRNSDWNWEYD